MPAKRVLPITIPASLDIKPEKVRFVKTGAGLQKQINAAAKAALSGLKITEAGAIGLSPEVAKMGPSQFRNFQRQYDKDTKKLQDIARGIDSKRARTEEAGGKLSPLDFIRQKALETTAKVREATKEVVNAERNLGRAVKDKLLTGGTDFTPGQQRRVNAYFESQKRLAKFLPELDKFQTGKSLFDPLTGRDVTLGTKSIKGLTAAMEATRKTASNLSKNVDHLGQSQKAATKQQQELTKATQATTRADKAAAIARSRNSASMSQFRKQLQGLKRATPTTPAEARRQVADVGSLRTRIQGAQVSAAALGKRHEGQFSPETVRQMENTSKRLGKLDQAAIVQQQRLGREYERLNTVASQVVRAKQGIAKASGQMNNQLGQSSLLIRQFFRYALGYGALYQALGAFNALTRSVVELDKALFSIKAIADATNDEMISISSAIKRVAIETKFTTSEVAKGARILAQAGVSVAELPKALEAVSKFAAGTETEIATAADLVSTMRNVFTELDDLDITNQLTKAINISKLTGQDLKVILGISAQVARQYNLTSEQYLSAVTTLRNAGLKASTTATGLRQGMIELFSPDSRTTKALVQRYKDLGEALTGKEVRDKFFGFTRDLNPLLSAARELRRLGLSGAGRKTLTRGFDVRATNALTALVNNLENLERAETQLASGDQVFVASATQMESLANSADNLGAAMTVLAADIAEGPIRSLEDLVDGATDAIQAITDLSLEAKSLGKAGASDILTSAVGGALLGAVLGRTPIAKFAAGIGGAVGGAAIGIDQLEQRAQGKTPLVDAASLNTAIAVVSVLALFKGRGALGSLFKGSNPSAFVGPLRSGVLGFFDKIKTVGLAFKGLGVARLLLGVTAIGAVITATSLLLEHFLTDREDENSKLKARRAALQARTARLEKQRQELDTDIASADSFRPSQENQDQGIYRAKSSSVAAALERNLAIAKNYDLVLAQTFEGVGDEALKQIEILLESYRTTGFEKGSPGYKAAFKRLADLTGFGEEGVAAIEEQINFLSNSRVESLQAAKGIQADFKKRLQQALDAEGQGTANSQQEALLATFGADTEEIRLATQAFVTEHVEGSTKTFQSLLAFIDLYAKNIDRINKIAQRQSELHADRLEASSLDLELLLKEAGSTNDISIRVQSLKTKFAVIGEKSIEFIDTLLGELAIVEQELIQRESEIDRRVSAGNISRLGAAAVGEGISLVKRTRSISKTDQSDLLEIGVLREQLSDVARVQTEAIIKGNQTLFDKLAATLAVVGTLSPERVKLLSDRPQLTATLRDLQFQKLVDDPAARRKFQAENILGRRQGGAPDFRRGEKQITSDAANRLIEIIKTLTALEATSPQDKKELFQPTFIRDPDTYRQIFDLDQQIKQAKKKNLKLLIDENESNPIIGKRNLLLKEKDRELFMQINYVNELKEEFGEEITQRKDRKKMERAQARLAQLGIDRLKIVSDARIATEDIGLKVELQILDAQQKRLEVQEQLVEKALSEAVGAGSLKDVARLNERLFGIRNKILDVEVSKLQLSRQDIRLTRETEALKRDDLKLQEDINRQKQEIAALDRKRVLALSRVRGDVDTQAGLAFANTSGAGPTVTEQQQELEKALRVQLKFALERNVLAKETLERERTEGATPDRLAELELAMLEASMAAGQVAGELFRVTEQLNGYFLTFENFRTQAIQDSIVEWYSDSPRTIRTFIESVGEGLRVGIASVFQKFADSALQGLVQRGMDATLTFLSDSFGFNRSDIKEQVAINANNVVITTPNAGGGDTSAIISGAGVEEAIAGEEVGEEDQQTEDQAANTQQLQNVANALVSNTSGIEAQALRLAANAAFDKLKAAQLAAQGAGQLTALSANTIALTANTSAQYAAASTAAFRKGGVIHMQKGGVVRGQAGIDKVPGVIVGADGKKEPVALTSGEGVLTTRAVDYLGEPFINALNTMKLPALNLAKGGVVSSGSTAMNKISKAIANMPAPNVDARTKVLVLHSEDELMDAMRSEEGERIIVSTNQRNASAIESYQ